MVDFLRISTRSRNKASIEIYPKFIIKKSSDLMIRGGDFYAVWMEDRKLWSIDEQDVVDMVDSELRKFYEEYKTKAELPVFVSYLSDSESKMIDSWHHYCQKQMRDNYHQLDDKLIFSNTPLTKTDYASKKLSYPLETGKKDAYEALISTLYTEKERHKIEWCIGSVVSGASKYIQKFAVFYGAPGTGKSTVINIITQLFEDYCVTFESKKIGSASASFALESFRKNPLVAYEHEGDLSRIEDNARLNSLVSHETMVVNEKYKAGYPMEFHSFLFIGTNKPVKITDAKSGLLRRLIDISPTGNLIPKNDYLRYTNQIKFELGAIASHCLDVFEADPNYYDMYQPIGMLGATNDFFNFVEDSFPIFKRDDRTTLKSAWELYKTYCEEAKVSYPLSYRPFKEELKNYFEDFRPRYHSPELGHVRNVYLIFKSKQFEYELESEKLPDEEISKNILVLDSTNSIFDDIFKIAPAQYGNDKGTPSKAWSDVKTTLESIDTSKTHYVLTQNLNPNHIIVDFDLKDRDSKEKSLERNLEEAAKWPKTYAELSNSGKGVHLHYIYTGDPETLSSIYAPGIEIKVFSGKSALRRRLTKCNDESIATISSGLPLKGDKKVVNFDAIKSENAIRTMIARNLRREYHADTSSSVDFINKILNDAYDSGVEYDVSDMRPAIFTFAACSTNQSARCTELVGKMKFKSEEQILDIESVDTVEIEPPIVFYDIEVFPNLLLICWCHDTSDQIYDLVNPTPEQVMDLMKYRLIGFNCKKYDNHIIYSRTREYTIEQIYDLSRRIIENDKTAFFGPAYNVSYTDIYDFCSEKKSLKKWEIEMDIHHLELGLPWDKPVPKELIPRVIEYCHNDVRSTKALFHYRAGDWAARQILASLTGKSVNESTNNLSAALIFGKDRNPQRHFNYRFMGDVSVPHHKVYYAGKFKLEYPEFCLFNDDNQPIYPGYEFSFGKSTYRGEEVGEGGEVFATPGFHTRLGLLDIASMHPSSLIAEKLFGELYTKRFEDIKEARVAIKRGDFDRARKMLNGVLIEYIDILESEDAWFTADDLAQALKIVINAVYGETSAKFDNPFRDKRNVDNIVAKRGALFMINLRYEVEVRGYTVAHIKTDSIKIPGLNHPKVNEKGKIIEWDDEIVDFVMEYGKLYGYEFEYESFYERICLVNDAVYIAKVKYGKHAGSWQAVGTEFAVPYVFKSLFGDSADIDFNALCETKQVSQGSIYLDFNENLKQDEDDQKLLKKIESAYRKALTTGSEDAEIIKKDLEAVMKRLESTHKYTFVGKVGRFCPMKEGCNAGWLMRGFKDKLTGMQKYSYVGGTKGYRWLESEMVKELGIENQIDLSYFNTMVDEALDHMKEFGNAEIVEKFIHGDLFDLEHALALAFVAGDDLPF